MDADEIERLRQRQSDADDDATLPPGISAAGARGFLCQTTTMATYPTAANAYYAVQVLDVFGAEVEGGAGTTAGVGAKFLAWNYGGNVPPAGSKVWVDWVPYRWAFIY